jgi:acyl-CoA hydrolase
MKIIPKAQAATMIKSGDRVFLQGAAMTPNTLINAICERYQELEDVEIISIHTEGTVNYALPPYNKAFKINSCFVGGNVRNAVNTNKGDIFLSEIHLLFRRNILPLDVALIQVYPPDNHGYCSLGVSVDVTLPAIQKAKLVIAQVNPQVPRTHGDGIIHLSEIDAAIEVDESLHIHSMGTISETEHKIGKHVANLIEDGSTLQLGIGNIPNAVLSNLYNHKQIRENCYLFCFRFTGLIRLCG